MSALARSSSADFTALAAALVRGGSCYADAHQLVMSAIVRAAVKNTRFSRAAERLGCNYQTVVRAAARASDARPYIPGVQRCVENLAAIVVSSHEPLWEALARFDRAIAQAALHVTGGNHCAAARLLQVHRNSIRPIERRGL